MNRNVIVPAFILAPTGPRRPGDAQVRLLETEWNLLQAKFARIVAAARAKVAAGVE